MTFLLLYLQIRVQFAAAGAPLLGDHLYCCGEPAPVDVPIVVRTIF